MAWSIWAALLPSHDTTVENEKPSTGTFHAFPFLVVDSPQRLFERVQPTPSTNTGASVEMTSPQRAVTLGGGGSANMTLAGQSTRCRHRRR